MRTLEGDEAEVRIEITEAGRENLLFRALLQHMLPLLRNPAHVSEKERSALLQSVREALEEACDEANPLDGSGDPSR